MPADKSKPAKAQPAKSQAAKAEPKASKPADDTVAAAPVEPDAAPSDEATEDAPLNRAERRAKTKAGGKPQVVAKVQPRNVNSGPAPRQWANRRSG